jgi:hypothetical protein
MKCVKYAKEHKVDIIHGHDYKTNLLLLLLNFFSCQSKDCDDTAWMGPNWTENENLHSPR